MATDRGTKAIIAAGLIAAVLVPSPAERFAKDKPEETPAAIEVAEYREQRPLYDVPLSNEIQRYIFNVADYYGIEPALILAVIEKESSYDETAIGDGGESYGLMQVQCRQHIARMDRLGVTDLLNPYENVAVGIDILAEKINGYDGNVSMALMAYNAGDVGANRRWFSQGIYSNKYSESVLEIKERIEQCERN